jgi:hypothetical protein
MRRRDQWITWIKAVERKSRVIVVALEESRRRRQLDSAFLNTSGLGMPDDCQTAANREATYLVRLSVVFESGLREVWDKAIHETTHLPMTDLLQAPASRTSRASIRRPRIRAWPTPLNGG